MAPPESQRRVILVVEDVDETRYGIERLLTDSGYLVSAARSVQEAIQKASMQRPDLILLSLGLDALHALPVARRIRDGTGLGDEVPVMVFCVASLQEGAEVTIGSNVHMARPDNFNQLRNSLTRLLRGDSS
jgi:two-component system response regulator MprA